MHPTTSPPARPASPWRGSSYAVRHRWQLERVRTLPEVAAELRGLAAELTAAHAAGWELQEPMRDGHLLASRPSRRRRAVEPAPAPRAAVAPPLPGWRLRVVDEPPVPGDEVLDLRAAPGTPVLAWAGDALRQVAGPAVAPERLAEVERQLLPDGPDDRRWGLAPARVGPSADVVADGSALRIHAVRDAVLVRTVEVLPFEHAADRAADLLAAAAAYARVAAAADAMTAAGGRLLEVDDGRLHVVYGPR